MSKFTLKSVNLTKSHHPQHTTGTAYALNIYERWFVWSYCKFVRLFIRSVRSVVSRWSEQIWNFDRTKKQRTDQVNKFENSTEQKKHSKKEGKIFEQKTTICHPYVFVNTHIFFSCLQIVNSRYRSPKSAKTGHFASQTLAIQIHRHGKSWPGRRPGTFGLSIR